MNNTLKVFKGALLVACSSLANGQLIAIEDEELSHYSGQAFITIDQPESITEGASTFKYTRINMGMDIETIMTQDEVKLGAYDDQRDITGTGVDIHMTDVGFGTYFNPHDYFRVNSSGDIVYGSDGLPVPDPSKFPINPATGEQFTYDDVGAPMPFHIKDPYVEFAFKEEGGVQSLAGMRIGYGGAKGIMTSNMLSMTGNQDVIISDTAAALGTQDPDGFFGFLLKYVSPLLLGDSTLATRAVLQQVPDDPNPGQALDYRATHIGVEDGYKFVTKAQDVGVFNWFLLKTSMDLFAPAETGAETVCTTTNALGSCTGGDINLYTSGCELVGMDTCFPLTKYQSIDVGKGDYANGMFLGVQAEDVPWRTDVFVSDNITDPTVPGEYVEGVMRAAKGFYMNIPTGGVRLDLKEATTYGLPRQTTRYTDASLGLF